MSTEYAVILVDSTNHALRIEKLLTEQGLECKLIPVPRHLSSDCGVCVRILKDTADAVETLLTQHRIHIQAIEPI